MSKVKYYYDSETLSYRKIERKKGRRLTYVIMAILACFLAGFILLLVFLNLPQVETPKEKRLKRELDYMKLQYSMMEKNMDQMRAVLQDIEERDNNIYRVYFEAKPISDQERQAGYGGINRYADLEGYENSELIIKVKKQMDKLEKRIVIESKSLDEIAKLAKNKEKLLAAIPAIQPIDNKALDHISSGFGRRWHPILKIMRMHKGLDYVADIGAKVYATADGVVEKATRGHGYGAYIVLDHGFGYQTRYGHLSKILVRPGAHVKRGQVIGLVGNTGLSTGPHLHYEVRKDGVPVNPINYFHGDLSPREYEILLQKSSLKNQSLD